MTTTVDPELATERLTKIKHIVVLMMENRSFDHMLGYLKQDGMPEVEGLTGEEKNLAKAGNEYPVHEFAPDETAFHQPGEPFDHSLDPGHGPKSARQQLSNNNGGFVQNFIDEKHPPKEHYGLPMGYYSKQHLPVYDFLARNYCVCDAWHSSIPGDTWVNRQYALAGRISEPVLPKVNLLKRLWKWGLFKKLKGAPIYDVEAFTRHLEDTQWRWYSHDPATLRAADGHYRNPRDLRRKNFAFFDRKKVSLTTEVLEWVIAGDSFLDDAAKGELRDVSWIDPNFIDVHVFDPNSNDDHPPSDVRAGQALALDLYEALVKSRDWQDTLLVIVYDEHGGFYDHVAPPAVNDQPGYETLGVRVPALVIGPRVRQFVCKEVFDHTSLIKTILLRFAKDPEAAIARMGPRVREAEHLGVVLADEPRDGIPDHGDLHATLNNWREAARAERRSRPNDVSHASDGAGQPFVPTEFQQDFVKFVVAVREAGLPPGQP